MRRFILSSMFLAALTGCAETPQVMRYSPGGEEVGAHVWPPLPEVPRYRYMGRLMGEGNFGPDEQAKVGGGQKFVDWLVGLTSQPAAARALVRPQTGMVDETGRIYVTDVGRQAVFVFDDAAGRLHIWDRADSGTAFASPVGISSGPNNEILVADSQLKRVIRLDREGNPLGNIGQNVLGRPTGLARDPATGHLYVSDTANHDIKVFDATGRLIDIIGRRGAEPGEFNAPTHLAFAGGKLYVSDTLNARVQVLAADGEPLRSMGERGLYVGNLTRPKGVAVDDDGNVYVAESYYDHLLIFNAEGKLLLPIGGSGAAIGEFFLPAGIWSDKQSRIFVADMFNGRVIILQYLGD